MSGYSLHPAAFRDLNDIHDYIVQENESAADRVLWEFMDTFEALARFPLSGNIHRRFIQFGIRVKFIRDYMVVYNSASKPLQIIAILHGRRNPLFLRDIVHSRIS